MKYNVKRHAVEQPLDQSIKLIPLTKGMNAIVDAKNYERLMQQHWQASKSNNRCNTFYARRTERLPDGTQIAVLMHREVMGSSDDGYDHIDGNGLNNVESNLRPCDQSHNGANRPKQKRKIGYKGVFKQNKHPHHPYARIKVNGVDTVLGTFSTEEEAARAYDRAAIAAWGEFAQTSFPRSDYE